jgi:hypothetical protein
MYGSRPLTGTQLCGMLLIGRCYALGYAPGHHPVRPGAAALHNIEKTPEDLSVPFTDPFRPQDQIEQVRKIGRLAQVLLEMRTEYEHKPRRAILDQILARIEELDGLCVEIRQALEAAPESSGVGNE